MNDQVKNTNNDNDQEKNAKNGNLSFFRSLRGKLSIWFIALTLIPVVIVGIIAYLNAQTALEASTYSRLEAVQVIKKDQIETYFTARQGDMGVLTETVSTLRTEAFRNLDAIRKLKLSAIERMLEDMEGQIHMLKDDPFIADANYEFEAAFMAQESASSGGSAPSDATGEDTESVVVADWDTLAEKYDARLADIANDFGWYDLFLIAPDGDIVYTVARESDLFMNVPRDLAGTSLGEAFEKAQTMSVGEIAISDFAPYPPSGNLPAAFMIAHMVDEDGTLHGYVAFQIPVDQINEIMQEREGLGETGETYLVGSDLLMRSDSYLDPVHHSIDASFADPSKGSVDTDAAHDALSGETGDDVIIDYNGNPVLSAYAPVQFGDTTWALIAEIDVAEAFSPKDDDGDYFFDKYAEMYGYYDLFLINSDGYVFFSAAEESDYQTNMLTGQYKTSGLGQLTAEVIATGEFGFADFSPYEPSGGLPASFIAQPLYDAADGELELIVALQLPLEHINQIMTQRAGLGEGESFLVGSDNLMRSDSFHDAVNRSVVASFAGDVANNGIDTEASREALAGNSGAAIFDDEGGMSVLTAYDPLDVFGVRWAIISEISESEAFAASNTLRTIIIFSFAIAGVISVVVALFVSGSIAAPILKVSDISQEIATGNLNVDIDIYGKDEVGILADSFREMVAGLQDMVSQIGEASANLGSASTEILAATNQQASGANEQSAAITQTTTTVDEVKTISEQSIERAQEVVDTSQRTVEVSRTGQEIVENTIVSMGQIKERVEGIAENILALSEQTQQIGEIIAAVNEISAQSNILALNASVEAARAGEHGKGFGVVAVEVRNLAEQSRQATDQVKAILLDIQNAINATVMATEEGTKVVDQGVLLASKTKEIIEQLSTVIDESAQTSMQMMAGGRQQASGVEQIAVAMQNINQATTQGLAGTRQAEKAAQNLNALAQQLMSVVSKYSVNGNKEN